MARDRGMSLNVYEARVDRPRRRDASTNISPLNVTAAILGNALEFFDFISYATFAVFIGRAFFPTESAYASILLSVATFGVGFITRPLGAILIGAYADRVGRKPAMTLTIVMMAFGTGMVGVLPGYHTIGVAAPILLVVARMIQGFSTGGEMGPATSYLLEASPRRSRNYYGSWQSASQGVASLATGIVGFALSLLLAPPSVQAWAWRVPFILGLAILPVGLYIRSQLQETLDTKRAHTSTQAVLADLYQGHLGTVVLGVLIISGGTVTTYFTSYVTTYALTTLHLSQRVALFAPLVLGFIGIVFAIFGGWLGDRVGVWKIVIWPRVLLMLVIYPALWVIVRSGSATTFIVVTAFVAILQSVSSGVAIVALTQSFPAIVRTSGLSIAYAIGVTIFGSTAQVIFTWLIHATGDPTSPGWYIAATNAITIAACVAIRAAHRRHVDA